MSSTSILGRCFSLLTILADAPSGIALGELAAKTGMPKSATHRMLSSLIDAGFVTQIEDSRHYRLTMKLVTLGFRFLSGTGLIDHCQGALDRLAERSQELVRMSVVDGDGLVWIAKSQGARGALVVDPVMGKNVALHATASGKVWLASLSTEKAMALVLRDGLGTPRTHGPNVRQTIEEVLADLGEIRKNGYSLVWEEADPGVGAIAVGIRAADGDNARLFGTVSLAGPTFRVTRQGLVDMLPLLLETAAELSSIGTALEFWQSIDDADRQKTG